MTYKVDMHNYSNDIQTYVNGKCESIHSELFFDALEKAFEKLKSDFPIKLANEYGINGQLFDDLTPEERVEITNSPNFNPDRQRIFADDEIEEEYWAFKHNLESFTLEEFLGDHKIKEIIEDDLFKPSKVILRQIHLPNTTYVIDLKEFWNECKYAKMEKQIKDRLDNVENLNEAKIIYIDYANGKTKLRDRMTGNEFWVSNDYLDRSIERHEEFTLNDTFTIKTNEII